MRALIARKPRWRITLICWECGYRNTLERVIEPPGSVAMTCHGCEALIGAEITVVPCR